MAANKNVKKLKRFGWTGVLIAVAIILSAVLIDFTSSYFIRKNLVKEINAAASKTTSMDELKKVFEEGAHKISQARTITSRIFNGRDIELSTGKAYEEYSEFFDDQGTPRDNTAQPKVDCERLVEAITDIQWSLVEGRAMLEFMETTVLPDADYIRDKVQTDIWTKEHQLDGALRQYVSSCIHIPFFM